MSLLKRPGAANKTAITAAIRAGDAGRDSRDWATAEKNYERALKLNPGLAGIWVQYGHALKEGGKLDEAGAAYAKAIAIAPMTADTHLQMGHLLKLQGRADDAAASYLRAVELDPELRFAVDELRHLAVKGVEWDTERLADAMEKPGAAAASQSMTLEQLADQLERRLSSFQLFSETPASDADKRLLESIQDGLKAARKLSDAEQVSAQAQAEATAHVVFDVSDLLSYFDNARLPTGIQRVQIEVITALLFDPVPGVAVEVCSFSKARDMWISAPLPLFLRLCELALKSGDRTDLVWTEAVEEMQLALDVGRQLKFSQGAYLINLGTSWWLQNYFLHVRMAKERYGIHYIPFVHDMIPVMTPEHCVERLTQDFISWALGVYSHADHFLTNSEASRRDLIKVGATLGYEVKEENVKVIQLNADFRKPITEIPVAETMQRYGLKPSDYVLFVSTVESRKNHLSAFKAWLDLIRRHGAGKVPKLVCVGNRGWLNDQVFAMLESNPELRQSIMMVSGVSDPDLANLYKACAFTLYPSSYEGWGLPVTESLCYGKVALLSDSSSLPEAGGEFAVYFKLGDQAELTAQLERLMFDKAFRAECERKISADFQPRPWRDLGVEIAETIKTWFPEGERHDAPPVEARPELGRYYWLRDVADTAVYPGMRSSEIFRSGDGWWSPDDWGSWTKSKGGALQLHVAPTDQKMRLYVGLLGLQREDCAAEVRIGGMIARKETLHPGEHRWMPVDIAAEDMSSGVLQVSFRSDKAQDFAVNTQGVDTRVTGVGVIGFMLCAADDMQARADFVEALAMRDLGELAKRR